MSDYLCNLIVPGAAKSGTSSLHEYLNAHPMVAMSRQKEPHHFCKDDLYERGAAEHNALFDQKSGARVFGESSTGYLPWQPALERIVRDLEEPKVIMVLRHPLDRTFSHFRWRYRLGIENRTFLDALKEDGFGYHPDRPITYGYMAYLEFSRYSLQCPMWIDALGKQNCLVLSSQELRMDHAGTMRRCFRFLGLPDHGRVTSEETNATDSAGRIPSKLLTRIASLAPKRWKDSKVYEGIRHRMLAVGAKVPPARMTETERAFVEDALANDIAWFERQFPAAV